MGPIKIYYSSMTIRAKLALVREYIYKFVFVYYYLYK